MDSSLWQSLLGPVGALVAVLYALRTTWIKLAALEAKLETEHEKRLEDAKQTTKALLDLHGAVLQAIDKLESIRCPVLHLIPTSLSTAETGTTRPE